MHRAGGKPRRVLLGIRAGHDAPLPGALWQVPARRVMAARRGAHYALKLHAPAATARPLLVHSRVQRNGQPISGAPENRRGVSK